MKLVGKRSRLMTVVVPLVGTAAVLAFFQLLFAWGVIDSSVVSSPTETASALWDLVTGSSAQSLWHEVWETTKVWALALALAIVVAVPLGFLIGSNEQAFRSTRLLVDFLRPIPVVALLPLFILLFSGLKLNVYLAALGAFWPLLIQAIYGVRDVDPIARETARAYRLGRLRTSVFVTLPSALPYLATGLRIAGTTALAIAVAVEMVVGSPGLGDAIINAQQGLRTEEMYGLIAATGFLGLVLTAILVAAERRTLAWHASQSEVL